MRKSQAAGAVVPKQSDSDSTSKGDKDSTPSLPFLR